MAPNNLIAQGTTTAAADRGAAETASSSSRPPQPWLLSTVEQLQQEKAARSQTARQWLREHAFPGVVADKGPWLAALQQCYYQQEQPAFGPHSTLAPPCPGDVAKQVLLDRAPQQLWLQLLVRRRDLKRLQQEDYQPKDVRLARHVHTPATVAAAAAASSGRRHEQTAKEWWQSSWSTYEQQPCSGDRNDNDTVVLAYLEGSKESKVTALVQDFLKQTGLDQLEWDVSLPSSYQLLSFSNTWSVKEKLGENLYHGAAASADTLGFYHQEYPNPRDHVRVMVPLELRLQAPSQVQLENQSFLRDLDKVKKQLRVKGVDKTYLLVSKFPSSQDPVVHHQQSPNNNQQPPVAYSQDTHFVVWLPAEFDKAQTRIREHFVGGKGETHDIQARLQKENWDSGNLRSQMFDAECYYIKRCLHKYPSKFCAALALLLIATDDTHWMVDNTINDYSEIEDLATYFRTILLKKSDEQLSLGLGPALAKENLAELNGGQDGEMSESRRGLYVLIGTRARRIYSAFLRSGVERALDFRWKSMPAKKRVVKKAKKAIPSNVVSTKPVKTKKTIPSTKAVLTKKKVPSNIFSAKPVNNSSNVPAGSFVLKAKAKRP